MVRSGRNVQGIVIVVLMVLLLVAIGYILFGVFQQSQLGTYQQGQLNGYNQAFLDVAKITFACQQYPLTVGNQTINLVAIECLQQAQ